MHSPNCEDSSHAMSFWEHLDALRLLLIKASVLLLLLAVVFFALMPWIFNSFILAPCSNDFPIFRCIETISNQAGLGARESVGVTSINLINFNLTSQFMLHISTSFWLAFLISVPALLYMLWKFVAPGLYAKERTPVKMALIFGSVMFFCGVAVSYFVVFPLTLHFLADYQLSPLVPNVISIDSYMETFVGLSLVMGLVFELPMLTWLLGRLGIITKTMLTKYRRHAVVALLILAAIITPTGDPFTLLVVFLPLYLLWEISLLLVPQKSF